jgi:plasmid stabilization system protein ParE
VDIELHPEAEDELYESAGWYNDQRPGLGDELLSEVERWIQAIDESPTIWPRCPGVPATDPVIRRALLDRFPFAIAYQAFKNKIVVLAIAHTSRRPKYWFRRSFPRPGR